MDLIKLYKMQKVLDERIQAEHQLENKNLMDKKILALFVELGELANETRCFKFWSKKSPAPAEVILEEYVDGIHFILSLGIDINVVEDVTVSTLTTSKNIIEQFHIVNESLTIFRNAPSKHTYSILFNEYILLGKILGYSTKQVEEAYILKNNVNHQRQDEGY